MQHEVEKQASELEDAINQAYQALDIIQQEKELQSKEKLIQKSGFWDNQENAQAVMKSVAKIKSTIEPWQLLQAEVEEIKEFLALNDDTLSSDIESRLARCKTQYDSLKKNLRFNGPYDNSNAVLTIQAGAGGTDAQDWAEMLKKMYVKWAEKSNMKVVEIDESPGEQAGVKQTSFIIEGVYAYGQLAGEHGVHRLVRQSPFNSASSRETSFAMVEVIPEIGDAQTIEIEDKDLNIDVYRAGGHGGQSVNTTDSAVRITHIPTGVVVAIQNERSQQQNKDVAMKILTSKLVALSLEQHKEKLEDLKGPNIEAAWGNQIRSYVLHPYTLVKDARTKYETSDVQSILGGELQPIIDSYLDYKLGITSV